MSIPKMWVPKGWQDYEKQRVTPWLIQAKCYSIIDVWTQKVEFSWKVTNQRKFIITFETKQMWTFKDKATGKEVQKPLVIWKKYTLSLWDKSTLKKDLKSWLNKDPDEWFDIFSMISKPALLQVMEDIGKDWKTYTNINAVLPSEVDFELINEVQTFSLEKDFYSENDFRKLPEFMQKQIVMSPEYYRLNDGRDEGWDIEEEDEVMPF